MRFRVKTLFAAFGIVPGLVYAAAEAVTDGPKISYNFQIRPILAEHCFKCHGMDEKQRKAKLRLDVREDALAGKSLVPGDPEASELIKRIVTTDDEEVMPPPKEHRPLHPEQVALLRRWIMQGAPYETHWAFIPPTKPPVPRTGGEIPAHPIDAFVLQRLTQEGMKPSPPASRESWLRRVTLDLTGLPPTLAEIDRFVTDASPDSFERVVAGLLASPCFGERMASDWLDVARFADTFGRHEDSDVANWPYRDWVVHAFNANMPYDQFILWQTAGDMLPNAPQDAYLATAFNRLVQQSDEAGSNEEEFRCEHVADRMKTNGVAFLGLSLECARCHDHKYDPITQKDYYAMSSFLANVDELGVYSRYTDAVPAPSIFVYQGDEEMRHAALKLRIDVLEHERNALREAAHTRFLHWLDAGNKPSAAKPVVHLPLESFTGKLTPNLANPKLPGRPRTKPDPTPGRFGGGMKLDADNWVSVRGAGDFHRTQPFSFSIWLKTDGVQERAVVVHHSRAGLDAASRGYELLLENGYPTFALVHFDPGNAIRIRATQRVPLHEWVHLACTYDGSSRSSGMRIYMDGLPSDSTVVRDHLYKDINYEAAAQDLGDVEDVTFGAGARTNDKPLRDSVIDDLMAFDRELTPVEVRLLAGPETYSAPEEWFEWYLREKDADWLAATARLTAAREEENALASSLHEVMVMREMPFAPRPVYVLERGRFDARGEEVAPGTPSSVLPFPEEYPRNRLGYARWLTDHRNPLTARVFVNRVWQMFFGRGIVSTSEDFGIQGELPSHPELLDWLAVDFMEHGWNVKRLCEMIALSSTYRQSSSVEELPMTAAESVTPTQQSLQNDPENRLLSRGPRQRLTAEQLRDSALAVSGLLAPAMGGKSVYPYHPDGLYESSGVQASYKQSKGADLYRRSLYTYWKRTMPPPSMTAFDAPSREFCKARRDKSSSPLQALTLMNDPQFVEAARVLAENLVRQFPAADIARVQTAYRLLTSKIPDAEQQALLLALLQDERKVLNQQSEKESAQLCHAGERPPALDLPPREVAATLSLVRALMAYDEAVMKP